MRADFEHEAPHDAGAEKAKRRKRDRVKAKMSEFMTGNKVPEGKPDERDNETFSSTPSACDLSVEADRQAFRLADVCLQIPRGSLVCVVGRVGAGKSTLLSGLLGETKKRQNGLLRFGGTIAYGEHLS